MHRSGADEVAFAIRGPIRRVDLPGLCQRVCSFLAEARGVVRCDVAGVEPDAVTVDALARLQLAALRRGCAIRLCNASPALLELVELMGLANVLCESEVRSPAAARSAGSASRRRGRT